MRFTKLVPVLAFCALATSNAFAKFTFSDVAVTSTTVTFTIDGDMTGYDRPFAASNQFSISYSGSSFSGIFDYTPNSWSESVFDNFSIINSGNTGGFGSTTPYSWSWYNDELSAATATHRTVTLTTANDLGAGTSGTLTFEWGNGYLPDLEPTAIGSVNLSPSAVPESSSLAMMALGLAALGGLRRLRPAKSAA